MPLARRNFRRRTNFASVTSALIVCCLSLCAPQVQAQSSNETAQQAGRFLAGLFLGISGYWFTDSSGIHGLGSPKFGGTTDFFVKDAHRHNLMITGGIEIVSASDHWTPFSGTTNGFSLTGAAVRVSAERKMFRLVPFGTLGLYDGHIHSDNLGIKTDVVVPSAAVGLRYQFHRYVAITARYRVTPKIAGIDTSGFSLGLSIF